MKHWPFEVISDGGRPKLQVEYKGETKSFYPEEVSSMVLTKMKEIAEAYLGKVIVRKTDGICWHLYVGIGYYAVSRCPEIALGVLVLIYKN